MAEFERGKFTDRAPKAPMGESLGPKDNGNGITSIPPRIDYLNAIGGPSTFGKDSIPGDQNSRGLVDRWKDWRATSFEKWLNRGYEEEVPSSSQQEDTVESIDYLALLDKHVSALDATDSGISSHATNEGSGITELRSKEMSGDTRERKRVDQNLGGFPVQFELDDDTVAYPIETELEDDAIGDTIFEIEDDFPPKPELKQSKGESINEASHDHKDESEPSGEDGDSDELTNTGRTVIYGEVANTKEWKDIISQTGFAGDLDVAASLMESLGSARAYFAEQVEGTEVKLPNISILKDETGIVAPAASIKFSDSDIPEISLKKSFLEQFSQAPLGATLDITSDQGEVIFRGTTHDFFTLVGHEETHHSIFRIVVGEENIKTAEDGLQHAEYQASEIEWQALVDRVEFAKSKGMGAATIRHLEEMRERATKVRKEQGLPTHRIDLLTQQPLED